MKITILFLALIALGFSVKAQRPITRHMERLQLQPVLLYRRKLLNLYSPIMGST